MDIELSDGFMIADLDMDIRDNIFGLVKDNVKSVNREGGAEYMREIVENGNGDGHVQYQQNA